MLRTHACTHTHTHRFIRAQHYSYQYTEIGSKEAREGHWWRRKLIGRYMPTVSQAQMKKIAKEQEWTWYKPPKRNKTK